MPYPLPPWIRPPGDLGAAYISAFHAGAAVAEEQARLSMQAQQAEIQAGAAEKRLEAQSLKEQQQLQLSKALHDAQLGLRQEQLSQAQQRIKLTADRVASQLAGQAKYQKLRESGMSAQEALLQSPELFPSGAGLATLASAEEKFKQAQQRTAQVVERPELPGYKILRQPTGYEQIVERPTKGLTLGAQISIQKEIAKLTKEKASLIADPTRAAEIDREIGNWKKFGQPTAPSQTPAAPVGAKPATGAAAKRYKYNYFTGQLEEVTSEQ